MSMIEPLMMNCPKCGITVNAADPYNQHICADRYNQNIGVQQISLDNQLAHPQRPVGTQLQRIENGLDLLLQGQTALEAVIRINNENWASVLNRVADRLAAIEKNLKNWLAEEAIAVEILKKSNEKAAHNTAMRARPALRVGKRRTATNRGSK